MSLELADLRRRHHLERHGIRPHGPKFLKANRISISPSMALTCALVVHSADMILAFDDFFVK